VRTGKVSGHDEVVLDDEGSLLGVEDEPLDDLCEEKSQKMRIETEPPSRGGQKIYQILVKQHA